MALALLYATVELVRAWSEFENCENPMQIWLLISYFSIALFRVIHILGFPNGTAGNDQWFMRLFTKRKIYVSVIMVGILYPFLLGWVLLGTYWYAEIVAKTPE